MKKLFIPFLFVLILTGCYRWTTTDIEEGVAKAYHAAYTTTSYTTQKIGDNEIRIPHTNYHPEKYYRYDVYSQTGERDNRLDNHRKIPHRVEITKEEYFGKYANLRTIEDGDDLFRDGTCFR